MDDDLLAREILRIIQCSYIDARVQRQSEDSRQKIFDVTEYRDFETEAKRQKSHTRFVPHVRFPCRITSAFS